MDERAIRRHSLPPHHGPDVGDEPSRLGRYGFDESCKAPNLVAGPFIHPLPCGASSVPQASGRVSRLRMTLPSAPPENAIRQTLCLGQRPGPETSVIQRASRVRRLLFIMTVGTTRGATATAT